MILFVADGATFLSKSTEGAHLHPCSASPSTRTTSGSTSKKLVTGLRLSDHGRLASCEVRQVASLFHSINTHSFSADSATSSTAIIPTMQASMTHTTSWMLTLNSLSYVESAGSLETSCRGTAKQQLTNPSDETESPRQYAPRAIPPPHNAPGLRSPSCPMQP